MQQKNVTNASGEVSLLVRWLVDDIRMFAQVLCVHFRSSELLHENRFRGNAFEHHMEKKRATTVLHSEPPLLKS